MISNNVRIILDRISQAARKVNRNHQEILIIAVTKGIPIDKIKEAIDSGLTNFGENRIQEFEQKASFLINYAAQKNINLKFHMIGHLQTNKVNKALKIFDMIQSVDSLRLVKKINQSTINSDKKIDILIEINISEEYSKFGIPINEAIPFLKKACDFEKVQVRGLMAMAPIVKDKEEARPYFRALRQLRDKILEINDSYFRERIKMDYLSMGMSQDYEVAVEEGSNMLRIGRAIFSSDYE